MDDMAKAGCECDNASDKAIQTCVERAAAYAEIANPTALPCRALPLCEAGDKQVWGFDGETQSKE